ARTDVAPSHVAALAKGFWHGDVQMTAAAVDLLPAESRGEWIAEVAAAYVQHDTEAALSWLSRYRGEPQYDDWISAAALSIASNSSFGFDAVAAARMLATAETIDPAAVTPIVQRWARQEPQAAADWALALRDPAARSAGAAAAAQAWAFNDVEVAARWALGLPSGDVRDAA